MATEAAVVDAGTPDEPITVVLFYKYVLLGGASAAAITAQVALCGQLGLNGRVLVSVEGINGTLSSNRPNAVEEYMAAMDADPAFGGDIDWKTSSSAVQPFPDLIVKRVTNLVAVSCSCTPSQRGLSLSLSLAILDPPPIIRIVPPLAHPMLVCIHGRSFGTPQSGGVQIGVRLSHVRVLATSVASFPRGRRGRWRTVACTSRRRNSTTRSLPTTSCCSTSGTPSSMRSAGSRPLQASRPPNPG